MIAGLGGFGDAFDALVTSLSTPDVTEVDSVFKEVSGKYISIFILESSSKFQMNLEYLRGLRPVALVKRGISPEANLSGYL